MTIQILGDGASAQTLRSYLMSLGYEVSGSGTYTIRVEEGSGGNLILEGVRGAFADEVLHAVAELTGSRVEWRRAVTHGNDRELRVIANGRDDDALERGVLRAVLKLTGHGSRQAKRPSAKVESWIRRILRKET